MNVARANPKWDDPRSKAHRDALEHAKGLIEAAFNGTKAPKAYVVVREEGGAYSFPPYDQWKRSGAPIIGIWDGEWMYLADSIIKGYRARSFGEDDYKALRK